MIRRWIRKGEDIGKYCKKDIEKIENWINHYPRKIFGGLSSHEMFVQNEQIAKPDPDSVIGKK